VITKIIIFFSSDRARGGELFERIIANGHFYEFEAASIIYSLCDGVNCLHQMGIVHRDIKVGPVFKNTVFNF
jgi:calcium/calmodulin-dependent protein kinase I